MEIKTGPGLLAHEPGPWGYSLSIPDFLQFIGALEGYKKSLAVMRDSKRIIQIILRLWTEFGLRKGSLTTLSNGSMKRVRLHNNRDMSEQIMSLLSGAPEFPFNDLPSFSRRVALAIYPLISQLGEGF